MISPRPNSDPLSTTPDDSTIQCVPSASTSASPSASPTPPGHAEVQCVRPSPTLTGTDALNEPSATPLGSASDQTDTHPTWTPTHHTTRDAWEAVTANIRDRQDRGLWSSRELATTIAQHAGLHRPRAVDLIRSAIKHGYLVERGLGPGHTTQVRLMNPTDGVER